MERVTWKLVPVKLAPPDFAYATWNSLAGSAVYGYGFWISVLARYSFALLTAFLGALVFSNPL